MNEHQQGTLDTLQLLNESASKFHGRTLDPMAVRYLASYIQNLQLMLLGADNLLAAYVNEYGDELLLELAGEGEEFLEGIIVEGEKENGLDNETVGLDAQAEEEE